MSGNFNSLDAEHKRELLFNSMALYTTLNKVGELTGLNREQVISALHGALEVQVNILTDEEVSRHIETMEAVFQNPEQFIVESKIEN